MRAVASPAVLAVGLALAWAAGCRGGASVDHYTDLIERASQLELLDDESVRVLTWNLSGDHRPLLFQHPPSRLVLGPLPDGEDCRLRFAIGLSSPAWEKSDGVEFRVLLSSGGEEIPVFEELLVPTQGDEARWLEREVLLPSTGAAGDSAPVARELTLETSPGPAGSRYFDHAGWAAPHLVCRQRAHFVRSERPHVILVSVDTLRADHLGLYGYPLPTSPALDRLGRESLVFENAFTPAPWTLPSHASMFTGLEPHQHGAGHAAPLVPLPDGLPTLAELLAEAGYRTLGFTAGGLMSQRNGLGRGFEHWTEHTRANLASLLPAVFAALGSPPQEPVFLFLHTYDVHGPYAQLPGIDPFPEGDKVEGGAPLEPGEWERIRAIPYHRYQQLERFRGLEEVVGAYDSGIRWVDERLGELFGRLREIGIYDDALIVVTSDHGESLYDHSLYLGHSYTLYEEEIRVPLIVKLPGGARQARVEELVSLVDLLPLILGVAGIESPSGIAGSDPLLRMAGGASARTAVGGEATHTGARYARSRSWKLIGQARGAEDPDSRLPVQLRDRFVQEPQLYDLGEDRRETRNLEPPGDALAVELQPLYDRMGFAPRPGSGADERAPDSEEVRQLRALGYVE